MLLTLNRFLSNQQSSLSQGHIDGEFECFFLEDAHQTQKIYGKTRIPAGLYTVKVRKHGGFHQRYSERFDFHRGMLEIVGIPNFSDVLLHIGNTHLDTKGCPLCGRVAFTGRNLSVGESAAAYESLYTKLIDAAEKGQLKIRIIDNDFNFLEV